MKHLTLCITIALASGCSSMSGKDVVGSLATNYLFSEATSAAIQNSSITSEQVVDAVQDARAYITTEEKVTVSQLYVVALSRISGLKPAERMVITTILSNTKARLETAMASGALPPDEKVALLDTLSWIEATARGRM